MEYKFSKIADKEMRLDYKGMKFLLIQQKRGVYSNGAAVQLYSLDGVKKEHVKELGWVKGDGYGGENKSNSYLNGIVTWSECKQAAIDYLNSIL